MVKARSKPSIKKEHRVKKRAEYTIEEFMAMALPEASEIIQERIGCQYTGPFMERYNAVKAAYETSFPKLKPVLEKLDLLLASEDRPLIELAVGLKSLPVKSLKKLKNKTPSMGRGDLLPTYSLASSTWETWPHVGMKIELEKKIKNVGNQKDQREIVDRRNNFSMFALMTECHEVIDNVHGVWIPELEPIFSDFANLLERIPE